LNVSACGMGIVGSAAREAGNVVFRLSRREATAIA
jgi:hypothetical protein